MICITWWTGCFVYVVGVDLGDVVRFTTPAAAQEIQRSNGRLVPKVKVYRKKWLINTINRGLNNAASGEGDQRQQQQQLPKPKTVVWHRDIAAAKCILEKGMCGRIFIENRANAYIYIFSIIYRALQAHGHSSSSEFEATTI